MNVYVVLCSDVGVCASYHVIKKIIDQILTHIGSVATRRGAATTMFIVMVIC